VHSSFVRLLLMCAVLTTNAAPVGEVRFGSDATLSVPIATSEGKSHTATLTVRAAELILTDGKKVSGSAILLQDPESRLYWWSYEESLGPVSVERVIADFSKRYRFVVDTSRVGCMVVLGDTLWVRTSAKKSVGIEADFERTKADLQSAWPRIASGAETWFQELSLVGILPKSLFAPENFGEPLQDIWISEVSAVAKGWKLKIANAKGDAAEIMVNRALTAASAPK
jgi:hypothetical protein